MDRFLPTSDPNFFASQQSQWSSPPVDGVGYVQSADLLKRSDGELRDLVARLERERYHVGGWRNHGNRWRELLGLDSTRGKRVVDYGCGTGVEALQFARGGNEVHVADISESNVALAQRVVELHGLPRPTGHVLGAEYPFFDCAGVDVFYCNGVLHHIPRARRVLERAAELLAPGGEVRLMVYSDNAWRAVTGAPLPGVDEDVEQHPQFKHFASTMDAVGGYADWYSADKLRHWFGDFLDLVRFDYITSDQNFCVAVMKKRGA